MNERNKDIERLIADGLIGESFGAFLAKDDEKEEVIASIRAAASATKRAYEEAKKTTVPFLIMEDGKLCEIKGARGKRLVKKSNQKPLF
ncbi:MAG: hypothetical protein ACK498_09855 [Cyclobacteriaceae bacterium]|jgi:hypothetical protein